MEMPEHVYVFAHEGVRWSLDHDRLVSEPLVGSINFLTLPDRALAAEVFRLAAENQRLKAALDGTTPAPAHPRAYALAEAALAVARVVSPESIPFATAACARLVRGEEDRPPRYQVLAMLHAMEAGAEHVSGPERAKEG